MVRQLKRHSPKTAKNKMIFQSICFNANDDKNLSNELWIVEANLSNTYHNIHNFVIRVNISFN